MNRFPSHFLYLFFALILVVSCQNNKPEMKDGKVVLSVNQVVMDFIKQNLPNAAFYTSKANPIKSLNEINCSDKDEGQKHGAWLNNNDFFEYMAF